MGSTESHQRTGQHSLQGQGRGVLLIASRSWVRSSGMNAVEFQVFPSLRAVHPLILMAPWTHTCHICSKPAQVFLFVQLSTSSWMFHIYSTMIDFTIFEMSGRDGFISRHDAITSSCRGRKQAAWQFSLWCQMFQCSNLGKVSVKFAISTASPENPVCCLSVLSLATGAELVWVMWSLIGLDGDGEQRNAPVLLRSVFRLFLGCNPLGLYLDAEEKQEIDCLLCFSQYRTSLKTFFIFFEKTVETVRRRRICLLLSFNKVTEQKQASRLNWNCQVLEEVKHEKSRIFKTLSEKKTGVENWFRVGGPFASTASRNRFGFVCIERFRAV